MSPGIGVTVYPRACYRIPCCDRETLVAPRRVRSRWLDGNRMTAAVTQRLQTVMLTVEDSEVSYQHLRRSRWACPFGASASACQVSMHWVLSACECSRVVVHWVLSALGVLGAQCTVQFQGIQAQHPRSRGLALAFGGRFAYADETIDFRRVFGENLYNKLHLFNISGWFSANVCDRFSFNMYRSFKNRTQNRVLITHANVCVLYLYCLLYFVKNNFAFLLETCL